jgi:lia operon protein LiaF
MFIDCNGVSVQNVEVSAGFGDLEIKLHGVILGEGLNRLIISSFIGDIRIMAPSDMAVFTHCSNFVGDVEVMGKRASGFGNSIDAQTANYQDSDRKLYVACNSFIGDIKIYGL